jgi:hypothetical protein
MTKEEYIAKMKYNKTSDGIHAYDRVLRDPSSIDHKFDPNCEQCDYKRRELAESRRRDAEEVEQYRIRQEEEKAKKKEQEREAAERRMMAAEDKPRTPPVVRRKKITDEEEERLRQLKIQEETALRQLKEVRLQLKNLNIDENVVENTLTYCSLCDKGFPSKTHRDRHMNTTKHKIRAGLMTPETYPRHCDTCDYTAKLKHHWEQHCEGKKHKARTEVQTVIVPTTEDVEKCSVSEPQSAESKEDIVESS